MKRMRWLNTVLSLLLVSLLLSACLSGNKPATEAQSTGDAQATGKPKIGGTLTVGMTADPDTLNPLVSNTTPGAWINSSIYPHLLTMTLDGKKVPYLAKSYEVAPDGKTITFKLKEGIKWQDGTPITSADVKYTGEILAKEKLQWTASIFAAVESVETPDDLTVIYKMKQPYPSFAGAIGYWVRIIPKHIWEKETDHKTFENKQPIGAGPFKLVKWEKGQYVELQAVDNWFASPEGRPYLDKVIYKIYPDINTMVLALQKGEIDVTAQDIPVSAVKQLQANKAYKVEQTPSLGYAYLSFNLDPKKGPAPTQDVNFRKAMAAAIDKKTIINIALEGSGLEIDTPISPIYGDWVNPNAKALKYDVNEAKKILDAGGYKDTDGDGILNAPSQFGGKNVEPTVMYDAANAFHQKTSKIVADNAKAVGINLKLTPVEYNTLSAKVLTEKNFEMHIGKWGAFDEPAETLSNLFDSETSLNFASVKDNSLDEMIRSAKYSNSMDASKQKVNQAQEWFVQNYPVVPLYVQKFNLAYNSQKFGGFEMYPSDIQALVDANSLAKVYQK